MPRHCPLLDGASAGEVASRDLNPWKMRPIPLTENIVSILQQARSSQRCASSSFLPGFVLERVGSSMAEQNDDNLSPEHDDGWDQEISALPFEDFYPPTIEDDKNNYHYVDNPMVDAQETPHFSPLPTSSSPPREPSTGGDISIRTCRDIYK